MAVETLVSPMPLDTKASENIAKIKTRTRIKKKIKMVKIRMANMIQISTQAANIKTVRKSASIGLLRIRSAQSVDIKLQDLAASLILRPSLDT